MGKMQNFNTDIMPKIYVLSLLLIILQNQHIMCDILLSLELVSPLRNKILFFYLSDKTHCSLREWYLLVYTGVTGKYGEYQ